MEYLKPLLSPLYWFNTTATPFLPLIDKMVLILLYGLLIAGIGCAVYAKYGKKMEKYLKRLLRRYASALTTAGAIGLLLYAFTWQRVPILSMRFFFVLWFVLFAYWIGTIVRFQIKELPARRKLREEQIAREKWLPKKK